MKRKSILPFLILMIACLTSCLKDDKRNWSSDYYKIRTYNSPSAYYGKPISRIYTNPYSRSDYYFDNDQHYVPPTGYGQNFYFDPR